MPRAKKKMETTGGEYGQQAELDRAQDVVPAGPAVTTPPPFVSPDAVPNLNAPTNRPNEPITAGAPFGPGPGPRPTQVVAEDPLVRELKTFYMAVPDPQIARMIDLLQGPIRG